MNREFEELRDQIVFRRPLEALGVAETYARVDPASLKATTPLLPHAPAPALARCAPQGSPGIRRPSTSPARVFSLRRRRTPRPPQRSAAVCPLMRVSPEGGREMDVVSTIAEHLFAPALLTAAGHVLARLLPLISERINVRAVRLAKAKAKAKRK